MDQLAGTAQVQPNYAPVAHRVRAEATDNWDDTVAVQRFEKHGGRFLRGQAMLVGPRRVRVGETVFTASVGVVLATGSAPVRPPIPGLAGAGYWTNREAVEATEAPSSLIVLGGGAIGLELAQAFARFGSMVTVVEAADRLVRRSATSPASARSLTSPCTRLTSPPTTSSASPATPLTTPPPPARPGSTCARVARRCRRRAGLSSTAPATTG